VNRSNKGKLRSGDLQSDWESLLLNRDELAFEALYTGYFHYLSLIGTKRGFEAEQIDDNINELFLYIWENSSRLHNVTNYHNYIITSFLRKLYKNDQVQTENIADLVNLPDFLVVPSVETEHVFRKTTQESENKLQKYIEALPERQSLMIYQKFYLGLSYSEIAEANNLSINTVYNTIYKAIFNLKAAIGDNGGLILTISALLLLFFLFFFH